MKRSNHYDVAFEEYLRGRRAPLAGAVAGNAIAAGIGWYVVKQTYSNIEELDTFKVDQEAFTSQQLESEA